jgi:hypothetical protein
MVTPEYESLRLQLVIAPEAKRGAWVPMTLVVENTSARPLDVYLRGRAIAFDLVVTDAAGAVVWRRLGDEVIPAILRIETFAAGARLELRASWDQRAATGEPTAPGDYLVHGELLTEDAPLLTPAEPLRIGVG